MLSSLAGVFENFSVPLRKVSTAYFLVVRALGAGLPDFDLIVGAAAALRGVIAASEIIREVR